MRKLIILFLLASCLIADEPSDMLFVQMTLAKSKFDNPATFAVVTKAYKKAMGTDDKWGDGRNSEASFRESWIEMKDVYLFRTSFKNIIFEDSKAIKNKYIREAEEQGLPISVFPPADSAELKKEFDKIPLANCEVGKLSELTNPEPLTTEDI